MSQRGTAALGLVLLLWPGHGSAQEPASWRRYSALVERYAGGDRAGAVEALGRWSVSKLRIEVTRLGDWQRALPRFPLRAALMLHSDSAWHGRSPAAPVPESPHADFARQIAALLRARPDDSAFARRWYLAMTLKAQAGDFWGDARRWVREGLSSFPNDAELLLAAGSLEETLVTAQIVPLPAGEAAPAEETRPGHDPAEPKRQLGEVEKMFTAALAADPDLEEARLRLGRVWWRLSKAEAAAAALDGVLERSQDPRLLYLAHLFRGRIDLDAGRLGAAVSSYRAAVALDPDGQAARVALSHALHREGDARASRRAVEDALEARRTQPDPFWRYPWGQADRAEELLEALRAESRP